MGQTLWKGQEPWQILKATKSPVGGMSLYQMQGPMGELKVYREDKVMDMFALEKGQGPYAEKNKGMPRPEHLKNIVSPERAEGRECTECEAMNAPSARRCYNCGEAFERGAPIVQHESPARALHNQELAEKIKENPRLRQFMPSEVQRLAPKEQEGPPKPVRLGPVLPPEMTPPRESPGVRNRLNITPQNRVEPLKAPDRFTLSDEEKVKRDVPLDTGAVSVPETTLLSDEDTMPTRRQVWRPSKPLYDKPGMHKQVRRGPPSGAPGQKKPQADLAWRNEDGVLTAQGADGLYEIQGGVQKGHQQGFALYYKGKEMGVYGDASLATTMAQKHHRKQVTTASEPKVLPDQLPWGRPPEVCNAADGAHGDCMGQASATRGLPGTWCQKHKNLHPKEMEQILKTHPPAPRADVVIAPGVGRGIYMIRPETDEAGGAKKFVLYYKDRGAGSLQEFGVLNTLDEAVKFAQQHYERAIAKYRQEETATDKQTSVDEAHGQATEENWRRDLENERNRKGTKTAGSPQLHWDEVTPSEEWLAPAMEGMRYIISLEEGRYILYEQHRRWRSAGPTIGAFATLDEAMDAAEMDFGKVLQHESWGKNLMQASAVTPEMVLAQVAEMRQDEVPEIDIREMVMRHYPEVASQVLNQSTR